MDKQLRIIAGAIVTESKLSKGAKTQLLNFIQNEATDVQVKALLLDGRIISEVDSQTEEIINARFKNSRLNEGTLKSILGIVLLTPGGWIMWRGLKAALSEKQRRCGVLGIGAKRDACLLAAQAEISKRTIKVLQDAAKNCGASKDPAKCKAKIAEEIKKNQMKIAKAQQKLSKKSYENQAAAKEKAASSKTKII